MNLHTSTHTTTHAATMPLTLTASLVLFVGASPRPDAALEALLARDGMRCLWLGGVEQATQAAQLAVFDAAVLDATLADSAASPGLAQLRTILGCPLMLVAPLADEVDGIVALAPTQARFDGWALERNSSVLSGHGRRIELTPVQARLLQGLMDAAGLPVPRPALMAALPRSAGLAARSVDVYISRVRQRLELEGVRRLHVHMVRGCGYALQGLALRGTGAAPTARSSAHVQVAGAETLAA